MRSTIRTSSSLKRVVWRSPATTNGELVEAVEWKNHPFGVGVQYHPELGSHPNRPHPLFKGLIAAALKR